MKMKRLKKKFVLIFQPVFSHSAQVDVPTVLKTMKDNAEKAKRLILYAIPKIAAKDWTATLNSNAVRSLAVFVRSNALNCM